MFAKNSILCMFVLLLLPLQANPATASTRGTGEVVPSATTAIQKTDAPIVTPASTGTPGTLTVGTTYGKGSDFLV